MAYYKESVEAYHKKANLKTIKVRVLGENKALGIPDYVQIIKDQAAIMGCSSVNEYILDLIETDIRLNGLEYDHFQIIRGLTELDKHDEQ